MFPCLPDRGWRRAAGVFILQSNSPYSCPRKSTLKVPRRFATRSPFLTSVKGNEISSYSDLERVCSTEFQCVVIVDQNSTRDIPRVSLPRTFVAFRPYKAPFANLRKPTINSDRSSSTRSIAASRMTDGDLFPLLSFYVVRRREYTYVVCRVEYIVVFRNDNTRT